MTAEVAVGLRERDHLSRLNALLVLAMLMTESTDEQQILHMGASAAPSFAECRLVGVRSVDGDISRWTPGAGSDPEPEGLHLIPSNGSELSIPGARYAWAFGLGGGHSLQGCMVVAADRELESGEHFLLRVLAQQIGSAVRNSRLHALERATAVELERVNSDLKNTVQALQQRIEIHDRLTRAAVGGEGMDGIAKAVHEVTGLPVVIEDRYGNLRSWAGPNQPATPSKDTPARREQLVKRLINAGHPQRESDRVMTAASPRPDSVAVIALIDPDAKAQDEDLAALEYGATILSMELARQRSVADTEVRVRRDLVEDLLSGESTDTVIARGETFGRDLSQPHRVIVCERLGRVTDDDHFFTSVRRAARDLNLGQLLVSRGGTVVLLADKEIDWQALHEAVTRELANGKCRIGVGSPTTSVEDFPRSHREAVLALRLQRDAGPAPKVTVFDRLGVYRLLANTDDAADIERFTRDWLGPLLDYDQLRHADLVKTLHEYLECGGHYDEAAKTLSIHRSTLKYRLQRIREVSGLQLGDPDVNFNLQLACRAWRTLQSLRA